MPEEINEKEWLAELESLRETPYHKDEWNEEKDKILLLARSGEKVVSFRNIEKLFKKRGWDQCKTTIRDRYKKLTTQFT